MPRRKKDAPPLTEKKCRTCGIVKPITMFGKKKDDRVPAGYIYMTDCLECFGKKPSRPKRKATPEEKVANAAYMREYRKLNPEKSAAAARNWRAKNPEKARAVVARWQANHSEYHNTRQKAWQRQKKQQNGQAPVTLRGSRPRMRTQRSSTAHPEQWQDTLFGRIRKVPTDDQADK